MKDILMISCQNECQLGIQYSEFHSIKGLLQGKQHIFLKYYHNECSMDKLHKYILLYSISLEGCKTHIFELLDSKSFLMDRHICIFYYHKSFLIHKLHICCLCHSNSWVNYKLHKYRQPTYMVFKLDKDIDFQLNYKFDHQDKQHILICLHPNEFLKGNNRNIFHSILEFELDIKYIQCHSRRVFNLCNKHIFDSQNRNILFICKFHIALRYNSSILACHILRSHFHYHMGIQVDIDKLFLLREDKDEIFNDFLMISCRLKQR